MNNEEYLSREKYDELTAELKHLKTTVRREVAEQLEAAKALGDLSENAEYHEARDHQAEIEDRIMTLESILKRAVIIAGHSGRFISPGSVVTVKKNGQAETYTLVGSEEADAAAGKISHQSPLGMSLIGKQKGDKVVIMTPRGEQTYKIIDVK